MSNQVAGGVRLKEWRLAKGLTQEQAEERLGVDQSHLSRLERGESRPSLDVAFELEEKTDGAVPAVSWRSVEPSVEESGAP